MDMATDTVHTAQLATKADLPHSTTDTLGEPIDKKGPDDVASEF